MNPSILGVIWCLVFVTLEAVQYVCFGGAFQRISSLLFGSLAIGMTSIAIVLWLAAKAPATFVVLALYSLGAVLAALGAVQASRPGAKL